MRTRKLTQTLKHVHMQVNLLLRLCPLVPYNLMNFLMGLTATRVEDYAIGCFVGAWFLSCLGLMPRLTEN